MTDRLAFVKGKRRIEVDIDPDATVGEPEDPQWYVDVEFRFDKWWRDGNRWANEGEPMRERFTFRWKSEARAFMEGLFVGRGSDVVGYSWGNVDEDAEEEREVV